ncbi:MAG: flavodoxin-dependent (E)-4-hydroxy-3-methylbut-2-enyl-diphosphate synthase [Anaerovoracaceae bacterium]
MTNVVHCGNITIGGGAPISIQSMTNVDTKNVALVVEQMSRLKDAGCEILRLAIPDIQAATALAEIKKKATMPLVADIHFDYRLALASIEAGVDKIRINPGNIGSVDGVKQIVKAAKERQIPIRVGVNSGSLEKDILERFGGITAEGLAESALRNVKLLEDLDFGNIVISLKSSDVRINYDAYKLVAKASNHPIHVGVTEAGTVTRGKTKSAAGIGALLLEGIGDTMRVSLTADPVEEIIFGKELLAALGIRRESINLVSCPTCARTKVDLESIVLDIESRLGSIEKVRRQKGLKGMKVAVMGCEVNGPGEGKDADLGVACGKGKGVIFAKGQIIKTVKEEEISREILKMIELDGK